MRIDVHIHLAGDSTELLSEVLIELTKLKEAVMGAQAAIDALKVKVTAQTTVIESVKTLLADIATRIRDAADDEAEVNKIADELDANTAALSKAVQDNTPITSAT